MSLFSLRAGGKNPSADGHYYFRARVSTYVGRQKEICRSIRLTPLKRLTDAKYPGPQEDLPEGNVILPDTLVDGQIYQAYIEVLSADYMTGAPDDWVWRFTLVTDEKQ